LNDSFELPSLEEIEEMDRKRSEAIEALEISTHSVKCQSCGIAVSIVGKSTARNYRIAVLQKQIKWIEEHYHHYSRRHHGNGNTNGNNNNNDNDSAVVKQLKTRTCKAVRRRCKG
jgi:uncharacterized protein